MILFKLILIITILLISLLVAMYSTLFERKIAGFFQDRFGPDRAGPGGVLQPLADGIKLFFKEDIIPSSGDRVVFQLAPMISIFATVSALAVMLAVVVGWVRL